jgi:hypothetical protein
MADDLSNRGGQDRPRINVNDEQDLRYWTEKWSVTFTNIKAAVKIVGPMVKDVEKYLTAQGHLRK